MKILLILAGMLLSCGLTGLMLVYIFRASAYARRLSLHVGYAYTLIAFYVFYFLTRSAWVATLGTVILPFLLAGVRLVAERLRPALSHQPAPPLAGSKPADSLNRWGYPVAISVIVVLLAAWPYLLTGWGNYWQSGNYDMEDGLNGRDAYLENQLFDSRSFDMGAMIGDKSWYDFAKVTGTLAKRARELDSYRQWYAGDGFRFQYSSQAFWSELFGEPDGMDILLLQTLLNLVLMAVGIFYLSKDAFGLTSLAAAACSVGSVCSKFYLTTFYNGHVGSLIYCSLIPVLMYAVLVRNTAARGALYRLGLGGLIITAIAFAYPHPLTIIGLPLAAYWVLSHQALSSRLTGIQSYLQKHPRIAFLIVLAVIILLALLLAGLWQATEGYRIRQDGQYRAWGYTHDWLIVPLYLGLISPPMEGTVFAGSILSPTAYLALVVGACLTLGILLFCFLRTKVPQHSRFFLLFGVCGLAEYLVFRYFIVDSYYLYKFLYTHQFVFVIGVVGYVCSTRSRLIRLLGAALVAVNLSTDISLAQVIYHRPYNHHPGRYQNLLTFDRQVLERAFVDLTGGDAVAVRQTLKKHGVNRVLDPRFADFFIVPSARESDIAGAQFTETLGETGGLALKRAPANNYLMIRTWNEPEQYPADPVLGETVYRWMSHGKIDNLGIYIIRPLLTDQLRGKYLRICFQKGPSAISAIDVTVSAANNQVLSKLTLSDGVYCAWIPAEQTLAAAQPLVIHSGAKGKSLLPHDDRILLYRVFAVGWADQVYDDRSLTFLNNEGADIITPVQAEAGKRLRPNPVVRLGQGWTRYEHFAEENFRWVGSPADLILKGGDTDGTAWVELELEPGPSHGSPSLSIEATDRTGKVIAVSPAITGRNRIVLPLDYRRQQTAVYTLRTNSKNLPVPNDPRILNYRVFRIELASTPPTIP